MLFSLLLLFYWLIYLFSKNSTLQLVWQLVFQLTSQLNLPLCTWGHTLHVHLGMQSITTTHHFIYLFLHILILKFNSSKFRFLNSISNFQNSNFHIYSSNHYYFRYYYYSIYLFLKFSSLNNYSKFRFPNLIPISKIPIFTFIYLIIIIFIIIIIIIINLFIF